MDLARRILVDASVVRTVVGSPPSFCLTCILGCFFGEAEGVTEYVTVAPLLMLVNPYEIGLILREL